jgi:hypothetical protein
MSRFAIPSAIESATGATADIYAPIKKVSCTRVPNAFAAACYFAPASLAGLSNAESVQDFE